jgi:hypothetical protein
MAYSDEELKQALQNAIAQGDKEAASLIDGELQQRVSGKTDWKDLATSAARGYSKALTSTMLGGLAAKAGIKPQKTEGIVNTLFPGKPSTVKGEYAENVGAGASFGPGGVPAAVLGGAGGALAKYGERLGADSPLAQLALWMAPTAGWSALKSLRPGAAQADARRILRETTPQDLATANANVQAAGARGINMPIWQAAAENTPLRTAGESVIGHPAAERTQAALQAQQGLGNQQWVKQITDPAFQSLNPRIVDPTVMQDIRQQIQDVARTRYLDPTSRDAAAVLQAMRLFRNPPPTNTPTVKTAGNILNLKEEIRSPPIGTPFASASEATRGSIAEAVDRAMSAVPGYKDTLSHYGRTKDIAEIMARDAARRGSNVGLNAKVEGQAGTAPTALRSLGGNMAWGILNPVRRTIENSVVRKIDAALASRDIQALERLAAENPQLEALVNTLAQGMRSGAVLPEINFEKVLKDYTPNLGE